VRLRLALLTLVCVIAAVPIAPAFGVTGNPADRLAERPIDDYAYDKARDCRKRPTPGALALHPHRPLLGRRPEAHVVLGALTLNQPQGV
jgi:hypothetical protein